MAEHDSNSNEQLQPDSGNLESGIETSGTDATGAVTLAERRSDRMSQLHDVVTPDSASDLGAEGEIPEQQNGSSKRSVSVWRRRWRRFKGLKRGYYSFLVLVITYVLSFFLPVLVNNKALVVHYDGGYYFPAVLDLLPGVGSYYSGEKFGQTDILGEADYRKLNETFSNDESDNWVLMPLYSWNPLENDFEVDEPHPIAPNSRHILGTDDAGRDVFARLAYGFNVSISFAVALTAITYVIGILLGGLMGYFGGKIDLFGQRFVEIWENIPFLYTVIIISSIIEPSFMLLVVVLSVFQWIGISYFIRGEFFREKSRDYVAAAISLGTSTPKIIFRHILPNSLTPIITFYPFMLVGGINVLVSLDFLGFGLQPPTPSWGQLIDIGLQNLEALWLVLTPLASLFITLLLVTFIGEAVREAFDPKVFSRLR